MKLRPKKSHHSKKKLIAIIVASVVLLAGVITGGVFLIKELIRQNSPDFTMSDAEFIAAHSTWYKLNEDHTLSQKLIWVFNEDGTGTITTNGNIDTHEMTWSLADDILTIKTNWLYELTDKFNFSTNREEGSFTILDTAEDKLTTFVHSENML